MQYNKTTVFSPQLNILFHFFFLQHRNTAQVHLHKDVMPTQKQPNCKKGVALCKMASLKQVAAENWL